MDKPALLYNNVYIYWHGVFMAAAIAISVCAAMILSTLFQHKKALMSFDAALLSLPFGLVLSRIIYCVSNYEEFSSVVDTLKFADGGYGLYGAILGAFISAATLNGLREKFSLGAVCDSMAAGGALGIAAGRLAAYFSLDNVGIVMTNEKYQFFPMSIYDESTGLWTLATFNMEALAELVIFIVLCVIFGLNNNEKKGVRGSNGDIALLFIMLHGASEVVFDSMQMDALRVPGNSFVRMQQIIGAISLASVMMVFVIRSIKRNKFRFYHLLSLAVFWSMVAVAAYMEFDRISDTNYFRNHGIMLIAMLCASAVCIAIYSTTLNRRKT